MNYSLQHALVSLIWLTLLLFSCSYEKDEKTSSTLLEGTWELVAETKIENGDTTFTPASTGERMIKVINKTHFSFLRHDLNGGKDSTHLFVAGGGTYKLNGNTYTENLEFCNFREWENHSFLFTVSVRHDTLIQQGTEKLEGLNIDRIIIEKYKRVEQ